MLGELWAAGWTMWAWAMMFDGLEIADPVGVVALRSSSDGIKNPRGL